MFSHQLQQIVQRDVRTGSQFLGVYAADELPERMPPQTMAIVNCCNRYKPGGHWLALFQNSNETLEIFDSFGLNPNVYNLRDKLPLSSVIAYSAKQLQSIDSTVCGQYCLYYCYKKARGSALSDIVSIFSEDYYNNDDYVYYTVLRLFNL